MQGGTAIAWNGLGMMLTIAANLENTRPLYTLMGALAVIEEAYERPQA